MNSTNLSLPWHSTEHAVARDNMCVNIVDIINKRQHLPPDKSMDIAKLIEIRLYGSASSLEE